MDQVIEEEQQVKKNSMNTKSKEFGSALAVLRIIGVEAMHNLKSDTKKIRLVRIYKFFYILEQGDRRASRQRTLKEFVTKN